jgi:hypothetical protein
VEPAGWSGPEILGDGGMRDEVSPRVAASAGGDAIAVWSTFETIVARRFSRRQGWAPIERIDAASANSRNDPRVAMDSAGNAIAVWSEPFGLWANRYAAGRGWSGPQRISNPHPASLRTSSFSGVANVAMDGSGGALALWNQNTPAASRPEQVWSNRFAVAGGWGTPQQLQAGRGDGVWTPDLAVTTSGEALAVWLRSPDRGTPPQEIWASAFLPSRSWDAPAQIEPTDGAVWVNPPRVALDTRGNALVVWNRDNEVVAKRFVGGGGWTASEQIGLGGGSEVATDAQGNALAVWAQPAGIVANRFVVGAGWTGAERIDGQTGDAAVGPALAVEPAGHAWVTWTDVHGTRGQIVARRFLVGHGWEAPVAVSQGTADAMLADVAVDSAGNVVVVWREGHGDLTGQRVTIWARRFVAG